MNSSLWVAFQQKLETKLLFLHEKKFLKFLVTEIKKSMKIASLENTFLKSKGEAKGPDRKILNYEEFKQEYQVFVKVNEQNIKKIY